MRARSSVPAAAFTALAMVLAASGIGQAADHGSRPAAAAGKVSKPTAKRGRRGPRGSVGPAGAAGKAGVAGKAGAPGKEGPVGAEGPGAIISMETLPLANSGVNHESTFAFVGQTSTVTFDVGTTALVTASLDFASHDGKKIESAFAICADAVDSAEIFAFRTVNVRFQARAENYFAQTDSAIVQGLHPGRYTIGACTAQETMNTAHGQGAATVVVGEGGGN